MEKQNYTRFSPVSGFRFVLRCRRRVSVRYLVRVLLSFHHSLPLLVRGLLCGFQLWRSALHEHCSMQS